MFVGRSTARAPTGLCIFLGRSLRCVDDPCITTCRASKNKRANERNRMRWNLAGIKLSAGVQNAPTARGVGAGGDGMTVSLALASPPQQQQHQQRRRLETLPLAVVGVPIAPRLSDRASIDDSFGASSNSDPFSMDQIDPNLTLTNVVRVALATFGVTAAFAAINTPMGTRHKLQCTMSAATCFVASVFYMRMYTIRRTKGIAYSRTGNTSIDSQRYACWTVANGVMAWLAMVLRGPFEGRFYDMSYEAWIQLAPTISSLSVIVSASAQFCVESARFAAADKKRIQGGILLVLGGVLTALAATAAVHVSYAIHMPAPRTAEARARSDTEINIGRSLGIPWIIYPVVNATKLLVTIFIAHNPKDLFGETLGRVLGPVQRGAQHLRDGVVWTLRMVSHSYAYAPLADEKDQLVASQFGKPLLPIVYLQIFDIALGICDVVSIGLPALACTALALPVYS